TKPILGGVLEEHAHVAEPRQLAEVDHRLLGRGQAVLERRDQSVRAGPVRPGLRWPAAEQLLVEADHLVRDLGEQRAAARVAILGESARARSERTRVRNRNGGRLSHSSPAFGGLVLVGGTAAPSTLDRPRIRRPPLAYDHRRLRQLRALTAPATPQVPCDPKST